MFPLYTKRRGKCKRFIELTFEQKKNCYESDAMSASGFSSALWRNNGDNPSASQCHLDKQWQRVRQGKGERSNKKLSAPFSSFEIKKS